MTNLRLLTLALALTGCQKSCPRPTPPVPDAAPAAPDATPPRTTLLITNDTAKPTVVNVAFGADSVVSPASWSFCTGSGLACSFPLASETKQPLPLSGQYLNATFAFDSAPSCGSTKAEVNVNNPKWYDILDVSLVDGFSNQVLIKAATLDGGLTAMGVFEKTNNEKRFGVFPLGCDICVARQHPPCGIVPDGPGCKGGTQYKPDVPCQYQGSVMGGGETVTVSLVEMTPATPAKK